MARICYFTWKSTKSWNTRSHSMMASKRKFMPNLLSKWISFEDWTRTKVKICSKAYKKMRGFVW